ncbi:hypothetical protein I302_106349 [Kwoniella bestiolae CBS 10118]|uniref:Xylanolytic transcriptional activator regulatory domain-containing protein n=1 Tax=Kwoniella bestiolae CBS 10118 TaxID=1296100 RepID=A0A1B9G3P0_9TREE|nr:hypothetical protein I302_05473 [Kwoniella bestiolae CBS 10118]OCF25649.1 hypothetical protein I302_05473 [Kwoniella bestiolae CBS 10118]
MPLKAIPIPTDPRQYDTFNAQDPVALSVSSDTPILTHRQNGTSSSFDSAPSTLAQPPQPEIDWNSWLSSLNDQQRADIQMLQPQTPMGLAQPQQPHILQNPSLQQRSSSQSLSDPQPTQFYAPTRYTRHTHPHPSVLQSSNGPNLQGSSTQQPIHPASTASSSTVRVHSGLSPPLKRPTLSSRLPTSPASGIESDEGSLEDAAKGLAMISLEAAAEPHYVGESSGSLWTTVISGGIHSHPHQMGETSKRALGSLAQRRMAHDPEVPQEQLGIINIRQSIQQPLPLDIASQAIEIVFRHLHPRYPFMDWVKFEAQWEQRDGILLAVGQGLPLDRINSTAAFFILMILAISAQLTRERPLAGLLRAEDYYTLASPYLNVIVTLHNLANIQGLLLLAVYSLRDSKGPSVWYLTGVTLRLCIGMGLHRNAAGWALRTLSKYDIEMRKRVFWSCYILDRMMCLLLGRPPGISDNDVDVDLPEIYESTEKPKLPSLQLSSMASANHHIKLKCIESRIQRSVYGIKRQNQPQALDYWELLNDLEEWENTIPIEASSMTYWMAPCNSKDWFLLKGVEARLHLLRPLCAEGQSAGAVFVSHLATHAARGCEIQKRMHQQGQPMSNASAHSAFICGLALLYAIFLQPKVMPLKDVFRAIKATSNTLFAYTQHSHQSAEVLYDVFEDLSAACIEHIGKNDIAEATGGNMDRRTSVDEWQKASSEATSNLDPNTAGEYVNILQTLGIPVGQDYFDQASYTEPLWELAAFAPGTLVNTSDPSGGMGM